MLHPSTGPPGPGPGPASLQFWVPTVMGGCGGGGSGSGMSLVDLPAVWHQRFLEVTFIYTYLSLNLIFESPFRIDFFFKVLKLLQTPDLG